VIVQAGASTVALKKSDGTVLWRSLKDSGGMNGSAFSSPIEHQFGDSRQILVQTRTELCGLDASNGRPLWSQEIPAFRGMNILTPTVHKDLVFTSSYGGKALGLKVTPSDDGWGVSQEWELKMQAYMSTPVIIDGHAYLHLRNQHFACVNLSTGESAWETKEKFGKYWSMIAAGNRILALDEKGELLLINASPSSFDVISRRKLGVKECWAHLAIAGDLVAIRSLKALEIFRWKAPEITQR
jgi:outer membrane protein assembly factor BamB